MKVISCERISWILQFTVAQSMPIGARTQMQETRIQTQEAKIRTWEPNLPLPFMEAGKLLNLSLTQFSHLKKWTNNNTQVMELLIRIKMSSLTAGCQNEVVVKMSSCFYKIKWGKLLIFHLILHILQKYSFLRGLCGTTVILGKVILSIQGMLCRCELSRGFVPVPHDLLATTVTFSALYCNEKYFGQEKCDREGGYNSQNPSKFSIAKLTPQPFVPSSVQFPWVLSPQCIWHLLLLCTKCLFIKRQHASCTQEGLFLPSKQLFAEIQEGSGDQSALTPDY